jgi:hypothetical protein
MVRHEAPAEDWEDVAEDTFSVVSLPTSEDSDLLVISRSQSPQNDLPAFTTSKAPTEQVATVKPPPPPPPQSLDLQSDPALKTNLPAPTTVLASTTYYKPTADLNTIDIDGCSVLAKTRLVSRESSTAAPTRPIQTDAHLSRLSLEPADEEDGVQEIVDHASNPIFFRQVLSSLAEILKSSLASVEAYRISGDPEVDCLPNTCRKLSQQIDELEPIISTYAKHWETSRRSESGWQSLNMSDIPLDPGLHAWMSGLRAKLLEITPDIEILTGQNQQSHAMGGPKPSDGIKALVGSLADFEKQMVDFLPIMQS